MSFQKHPHVRGEDRPALREGTAAVETPPRAWGRPPISSSLHPSVRNTPTCVGKTNLRHFLQRDCQKHPHVRGEDGVSSARRRTCLETPPRAWGRRHVKECGGAGGRNTPTCVGKTGAPAGRRATCKKHPHVRGEDNPNHVAVVEAGETPPRAWGRRASCSGDAGGSRNTPTCVGKTSAKTAMQMQHRKHPHVRGEDAVNLASTVLPLETPPRAWGRHGAGRDDALHIGNTPTCVGKTCRCTGPRRGAKKHPHVRGEDPAGCSNRSAHPETPPRAWGRHGCSLGACLGAGNTPTCVGKTHGVGRPA